MSSTKAIPFSRRGICLLFAVVLLNGCTAGEEACEKFVDVYSNAMAKCLEVDPSDDLVSEFRQTIIDNAAGGDCSNILAVSNRSTFYDSCIPTIENYSCEELLEGAFPESCEGQLLQ